MADERHEKLYLNRNLQILFTVTLMAVMGVSSITPAFPKIVQELGISTESVGLLITSFTLPGVVLTLPLGVFADRYGRKQVLVPGLFLFGIAGTLCFFARDLDTLLALRFFQGVGAASLGSLNVTVIGDLFSGSDRDTAMGYNASVLSIGTASYPAVGGILATIAWNAPFVLPILAVPVGLAVLTALDSPEPDGSDILRNYFRSAWREIWNSLVITLFLVSTVTFVILYGSYLTYLPILLDTAFGSSSLDIGIVMSTMSLTTAIAASQLSRVSLRVSGLKVVQLSFILYGVALLLFPTANVFWLIFFPIVIFGVAHGLNIPSIQTLLAGQASLQSRGAVMSLNGMVLRIGQSVGPLLMGFAFVEWGLSSTFLLGGLLAFAMVATLAVIIRMKGNDNL